MTTLIAVYDSSGRCIGRCDSRCYNAEEPKCECICGGRNHGAGFQQAVENTREWLLEELETAGFEKTATRLRRLFEQYRAQVNSHAARYEVNAEALCQMTLPLEVP